MKRILSIVMLFCCAACLFASCQGNPVQPTDTGTATGTNTNTSAAPTPDGALFRLEDLPRLDGSTANIPLASLILQRVTKLSEEQVESRVGFSTTPNAYINLIYDSTDLLLVYEADKSVKQQIKESETELEYHTIGKDALVFITNENNPVQSLTTAQIRDIYQGKIKNWKEVGGEDAVIEAFQRPDTSGSQALMVKLVMKGYKLMQAPTQYYPSEMGMLVDAVAEYNNSGNALGYSVFYYASTMYEKPGLKFLAVDGVAPSNASIKDGSYPFINEFYAVVRKDAPNGGNIRKLLDWILSDEGKKAVQDAGYVN